MVRDHIHFVVNCMKLQALLVVLAKNPIRPKMGLDWTCKMLLLRIWPSVRDELVAFEIRSISVRHKRAHQEVPFELHLRIKLVGLEDTEQRVTASNGRKP